MTRRDLQHWFADTVAHVKATEPVRPRMTRYVDHVDLPELQVLGDVWRSRSGPLEGRRLKLTVLDVRVRVMHDYLGDLDVVEVADRQSFWDDCERRMDASSHSAYYGVVFVNASKASLLVVHEDC